MVRAEDGIPEYKPGAGIFARLRATHARDWRRQRALIAGAAYILTAVVTQFLLNVVDSLHLLEVWLASN
jgi:hypothetical protein